MVVETQPSQSPIADAPLVLTDQEWAVLTSAHADIIIMILEDETYSIQALQLAESFKTELGSLLKNQTVAMAAETYKLATEIRSLDHRRKLAGVSIEPHFTPALLDCAVAVQKIIKPMVQEEMTRQVKDRLRNFIGKGRQTIF